MKHLYSLPVLVFAISFFLNPGVEAATKIRFGLNGTHSPPLLYKLDNQKLPIATGGFLYEISVAIAEELQQDYDLVIVPRGRIPQELTNGDLDLICHTGPAWKPPYANDVRWSLPIYHFSRILVSTKPVTFTRVEDIPSSTTIGTLEDFHYPDLEKRFINKTLFRDNSPSVAANISKLNGGRLDYIVMTEIEFPYQKYKYPQLQRSSFAIDHINIRCALSRKSSLSLERLNLAIERLKSRGALQKIYQHYTNVKTIPRPVVYALNNNDSPPFIMFDTSTETPTVRGGIFFELALEIGKQLQRPLIFVLLPRSRLHSDLAEGTADLVCFDNEIWSGKFAKKYDWSLPIFRQSDHIISLKSLTGETRIRSLSDLKGQTLGTTLNFVYPSLDPLFKKGLITREDADSGYANVIKLNLKRLDHIVLNKLEYEFYKKTNPHLTRAEFDIDPIDVKCAVSKKSDLKIAELNAAISAMKKNGRLNKVFNQ